MSHTKCVYKNCQNSKLSHPHLTFHRFPTSNVNTIQTWIERCGREDITKLDRSQLYNRRICSAHFLEEHFIRGTKRITLKDNAIPIDFRSSGNALSSNVAKPNALSTERSIVSDSIDCNRVGSQISVPIALFTARRFFVRRDNSISEGQVSKSNSFSETRRYSGRAFDSNVSKDRFLIDQKAKNNRIDDFNHNDNSMPSNAINADIEIRELRTAVAELREKNERQEKLIKELRRLNSIKTCACSKKAVAPKTVEKSPRIIRYPNNLIVAEIGSSSSKRIHLGEKQYKCEQCHMCFAERSHLVTHRRTKHHQDAEESDEYQIKVEILSDDEISNSDSKETIKLEFERVEIKEEIIVDEECVQTE